VVLDGYESAIRVLFDLVERTNWGVEPMQLTQIFPDALRDSLTPGQPLDRPNSQWHDILQPCHRLDSEMAATAAAISNARRMLYYYKKPSYLFDRIKDAFRYHNLSFKDDMVSQGQQVHPAIIGSDLRSLWRLGNLNRST